jgi:hypothetical protein
MAFRRWAIVLTAAVNAGRPCWCLVLYSKDGRGKKRIVKAPVHARKRKPHARHVTLRFRFRGELAHLARWCTSGMARPFPGEAATVTVS